MGCNCKKPLTNASKYSEEGFFKTNRGNNDDGNNSVINIFIKIINGFIMIIFGILSASLFIIMGIPLLVYAAVCQVLHKQPTIRLPKGLITLLSGKKKKKEKKTTKSK